MSETEAIRRGICTQSMTVSRDQAGRDIQCPRCNSQVTMTAPAFGAALAARTIDGSDSGVEKSPATAADLNVFFWASVKPTQEGSGAGGSSPCLCWC